MRMLSKGRLRKDAADEQRDVASLPPVPEPVDRSSPVKQVSFSGHAVAPGQTALLQEFSPTIGDVDTRLSSDTPASETHALRALVPVHTATGPLTDPMTPVQADRHLVEVQPGKFLAISRSTTTSLRQPVVIPGSQKKSSGTMRPPKGRRAVIHISTGFLMIFIVLIVLAMVIPVGVEGHAKGFGLFPSIVNMVSSKSNDTGLIAAQAATATAVTQDGYDQGNKTYAGVVTGPANYGGSVSASDAGSLSRFFYGQCTYWANMRYHQLTGHFVPWLGNAGEWAYQAPAYGWAISSQPKVPSIIVLAPGVQGAGWYGHVAVVEKINTDGSVQTSNWNWVGGWAVTTYVNFTPGPGVHFVWYPS